MIGVEYVYDVLCIGYVYVMYITWYVLVGYRIYVGYV